MAGNPDLPSLHTGPAPTIPAPSWVQPGAPTVQAIPLAMPMLAHVMLSRVQSLPPVNGQYTAPVGGMTRTAPGLPERTMAPPAIAQHQPTTGPSGGPQRPAFDGGVKYYP